MMMMMMMGGGGRAGADAGGDGDRESKVTNKEARTTCRGNNESSKLVRSLRDLLLISLMHVSCQNSEGLWIFPMAELTPVSRARHNHSNLPGPLGTAQLHIRPKDQAGDHAALVGCEPAHRKGDRPRGLSVLIGNSGCFRAAGLMAFAAAAAAARTRG